MFNWRSGSAAVGLAALILASSQLQAAPAEVATQIDLPAQSLAESIRAIARQTHINILVDPQLIEGRHAPALNEKTSLSEALKKLLKGTGLTPRYVDDNTVTLVPESTATGDDGEAGAGLEQVVVTAEKRQERLQDVPLSITVLSGKDLDKEPVDNLTAQLNTVPGVFAGMNSFGGYTQVTIRGVSAAEANFFGSSPVAYYIDSLPFGLVTSAFMPNLDPYDMERIEVLRGPQGTLYGANAQNGVVRILTHDPDLNAFDIKGRIIGSGTEYGGFNRAADAAINIPIIEGKLAARLVAGYNYASGWIDRAGAKNANSAGLSNLRLKIAAQPTDELSIGLSAWHAQSNYAAGSFSTSQTEDANASRNDEPVHMGYDTYGLKIGYEFPGVSLNSSTSYLKFHDDFVDEEGTLGNLTSSIPAHTFSQEVYLSSKGTGHWRWTTGLAYRDAWDELSQVIPVVVPLDSTTEQSKSVAVFGELTRLLFDDQLEATAGLRYFHDDVIQRELGPNFTNPAGIPVNTDETFHKLSPKAVLNWHVNTDLTTYVSYAQGFRSGFSQATLLYLAPTLPNARPDNLTNYEIGAKGTINRRVSFDTAAYYIHWTDVQTPITILVPGTQMLYDAAILNGKSASGPGIDGQLTVELLDDLTVTASASYNHLVLDSDVVTQAAAFPNGFVVFPKGSRENYSPSTTAGFNIQYTRPLTGQFSLHLSGSGNYTATQYLVRFRGDHNEYTYAPSAFDARLRAGLESSHGWTATLFVNNLTGSKGQPFRDTPTTVGGPYEQPRTIGLQVDYHAR